MQLNDRQKACSSCEQIFDKPYHCSKKEWEKRQACSRTCYHKIQSKRMKGIIPKNIDLIAKRVRVKTAFGDCAGCGIKFPYARDDGFFKTKYCSTECLSKNKVIEFKPRYDKRGENHHNWKGGITEKNKLIRNSSEYKQWRTEVFKRDNYTCQCCNQHGGRLNADHIMPFSLYPELRLVIDNGRTLCVECHNLIGYSLFKENNPRKNKENT